jgi:hypothetical protein
MNNIATPAAAGGAAGAVVMLVTWGLSLAHVIVPAEVAAAMMVLATPLLHMLAVRLGLDAPDEPPAAAPVVHAAPAAPPAPQQQ